MSTISSNLAVPPDNFSTTLSSGVASNGLTIALNSVSGLPTEGVGVMFTKDTNGVVNVGSVEIIHWTNVSGNSLILSDTGDRGLTGSDAGAQAYSTGAYFEVWVTSYYYASQRTGFVAEHSTSGVHDTTKVITHTATQTMTNKTLTAPIITTPTIKAWDGWQSVTDSWTYASADSPTFTITVPSGAASLYGVGWRIKLNQTTDKYFIITAVADTVITVYGGTDYTLANAAISSVYVSPMKSPLGFPMSPTKWTVETTSTSLLSQATPTNGTWYNVGTLSLVIPIGVWETSYKVSARADSASGQTQVSTALSTTNNGANNDDFIIHTMGGNVVIVEGAFFVKNVLTLAAKTTYYLNGMSSGTTVSALYFMGTTAKIVIRAVCSYL